MRLSSRAIAQAETLLAPTDFRARRDLASVLLAGALDFGPMSKLSTEDTERYLKRAMRLYGEVVAHDNTDVQALWGFGTAAAAPRQESRSRRTGVARRV